MYSDSNAILHTLRYSHQSTRKLTGGRGMDGRSQTGSRTSRSTPGRPHSHRGST